ncbi:hypothetical protein AN639_10880 [Candidatus Epulonipiscium fishelsonii]|uniref:Uncharacterized protein n=1 Tax=Candidatus Epulonipiscium fishelsonii TaxID=77094 RepID=A0ACC8XED3_9FIRM|nr:hypothetical protein AN396_03680 [Epulopiscium sp. SCG-B11WGA-EpuloA1]ONI43241.1 hypothetical protein AN639_10880 [Epulopiscium sp. SCG-B05WGA-EpuloA1]
MVSILSMGVLSGCGGSSESDTNKAGAVEVTMLGTIKGEIGKEFEEAVEIYNDSQDNYELVIMPLDGNAFERMTALYASGNTPTIMAMGQEAKEFQDKLLDLSAQPLLEQAQEGSYDLVTVENGKVLGFPITVEAFGLLVNNKVVEDIIPGFEPSQINSIEQLEEVFIKLEEAGKGAVHISPLDWSLGAHLTNKFFAPQSENSEEAVALIESLKAGEVKLIENDIFNGWLDTFDMLMEYNSAKNSPLSPTYEDGAIALGMNEVGVWFQGNWTLPMLQEVDPEINLGIMPYPISNDPSQYGNSQISVGVPMYLSIDNENATPEQQAGAIDFINWLFTSEVGQEYYVEKMKFIPAYKNVSATPQDSLSRSILEYMNNGKTLEWINMYYPGDAGAAMGATMQKYLDGIITREEVATEIEEYWAGK